MDELINQIIQEGILGDIHQNPGHNWIDPVNNHQNIENNHVIDQNWIAYYMKKKRELVENIRKRRLSELFM